MHLSAGREEIRSHIFTNDGIDVLLSWARSDVPLTREYALTALLNILKKSAYSEEEKKILYYRDVYDSLKEIRNGLDSTMLSAKR